VFPVRYEIKSYILWPIDPLLGHAVQCGILGTNSAFAPGSRKTTENLDRVGRSQDLPDAN
jgi:hypothetical protein